MKIRHFRYFVAVAEALSFAGAARDLNIAPQPLSKRVAELEMELGVRLFDRNSMKVELTAAGEAFLPQARQAIRAFDAAVRGVQGRGQSSRLRIALTTDTSPTVVADVINSLREKQVEVYLLDAGTPEQQQLIAAGAIDVGILRYPFEKRGLRASAALGQCQGVLISAEHALAKINKLYLHTLSPYPLVHFPRWLYPGCYDEMLDICRTGGYVPPRVLHSVRITPLELKIESAVALVPERHLKRCPAAEVNDFIWRPLEGPPLHKWQSVVCRSNEWCGITRMAVDLIFASLQRHDGWFPIPRPGLGESLETFAQHNSKR